jgi:cytochrome c oxidase subunit 1
MPRRIPDYPDAFYVFNKIASWGSYVFFSLVIFFWLLVDAFIADRKLTNKILNGI